MKTTTLTLSITYKGLLSLGIEFETGQNIEEFILTYVNDEAGYNNTEDFEEAVDLTDITWEVTDWGDVEDYENLQNIDLLNEIAEEKLDHVDWEVISAGIIADIDLANIEEAYQGKYADNADFAERICTEIGDIPADLPSYIYIDWERTARDIMMDYSESNGHYFRMF